MYKNISFLFLISTFVSACSGLKIIDPNKPDTKGTLQVDYSGGELKLVGTYTCTMVASNGTRVSGTAPTEADARKEAISKCQSQTAVSFCTVSKIACEKN